MSASPMTVAILLVLATAAVAGARRAWRRSGSWRIARTLASPVAALLLAIALFPPLRAPEAGTLVVLTGGVSEAQAASVAPGSDLVALPEVRDFPGAMRVADLASALRARTDAPTLRIIGGGLGPRDRDAAAGHALRFDPSLAPGGIVALVQPASVAVGMRFAVSGRVTVGIATQVALRDPANAVAATARITRDGRFTLSATAREAGTAMFRLRALDARQRVVDEVPIPVTVAEAAAPRVLFLAGAPSPELKYLRRWARDAGIEADARIALSPGIAIEDQVPALDAASLADLDLVVIDDRAWSALGTGQRAVLLQAATDGLGVLLRLTAVPNAALTQAWADLGLPVQAAEIARTVTLRHELGALPREIALWRLPLRAADGNAAPLLQADDADSPGAWVPRGRGRLALLWLTDSYRLVLEGHADRYGTMWSRLVTRTARARGAAWPQFPATVWRDERAVLCGIGAATTVIDPGGAQHALRAESTGDGDACAAYWPAQAGWHSLREGEVLHDFYVRDPAEAEALHAAGIRAATRAMVTDTAVDTAPTARRWTLDPDTIVDPVARWPWFAAWLAVLALSWGLERRVVPAAT